MSIVAIVIGCLGLFIVFSLVKKLIKLMFFAAFLLVAVLLGMWFLGEQGGDLLPEETKQKAENFKAEGIQKLQQASQKLQQETSADIKEDINTMLTETKESISTGIQKVKDKEPPPSPKEQPPEE